VDRRKELQSSIDVPDEIVPGLALRDYQKVENFPLRKLHASLSGYKYTKSLVCAPNTISLPFLLLTRNMPSGWQDCIEDVLANFQSGLERQLLALPTGAGKTGALR
jgi:hypothetical protein